jgi:hypothetical protein
MPVFENSRYAQVEYTSITGVDLVTRKYLHPRTPLNLEDVDQDWSVHEIGVGEDLDLLAFMYTSNNARKSIFWWMIADVNNILWPLDIPPGTDLVIPTRAMAVRGL